MGVDGPIKYIFVGCGRSGEKNNVGRNVACKDTFRANNSSGQLEAKST
jgi:hypothetical protein